MRLARLALAASAATLALTSACLNDRPVTALGSDGALALRIATASYQQPKQSIQVSISFLQYGGAAGAQLGPYELFDHTYYTDSGLNRVAATFPLAKCLDYFTPDALGPYCDVDIAITLRTDTLILDQSWLYGVRVRPGVVTQTDSVYVGAARPQPPVTSGKPQRGVRVETGLVRYVISGSDVNGDITFALSEIMDSTGCLCNTTRQFFPHRYATITGADPPLYTVVPGVTAMQYYAQLADAAGNTSYPAEAAGVDPPNGQVAPFVYAVTSDTTVDSIFVSATGFSSLSSTQQVEFVVRSVPNQLATDTIYMVCTLAAPGQFSTVAGGCPRVGPRFTAAFVVAVPVDSLSGGGSGASCGLGLICNFGTIYPRRQR